LKQERKLLYGNENKKPIPTKTSKSDMDGHHNKSQPTFQLSFQAVKRLNMTNCRQKQDGSGSSYTVNMAT